MQQLFAGSSTSGSCDLMINLSCSFSNIMCIFKCMKEREREPSRLLFTTPLLQQDMPTVVQAETETPAWQGINLSGIKW